MIFGESSRIFESERRRFGAAAITLGTVGNVSAAVIRKYIEAQKGR